MDLTTARTLGDSPADQFLDRLFAERGPEGFRELFTAMINRVEMPFPTDDAVTKEWLEEHQRLPDWAEPKRIAAAQRLFYDHGPKILLLLYYKSLPLLYLNARGAEVLIRTGRLHRREPDWANFTRRIAETAQFLVYLMPEGSLTDESGPGRAITQRIRLIHAAIRRTLGEDWDTEELGVPINQEDLLQTLLTFGSATVEGLRESFGLSISDKEAEDYIHFWNIVGHLLGIHRELLPANATEAKQQLELILSRQASPSYAGGLLTEALLNFAQEALKLKELETAPSELIRFFIGSERATQLGISSPAGCLGISIPHFIGALFRWGERLEEKATPAKRALLDRLGLLTVSAMINYFDRHTQRPFVLPESLLEAWRLQPKW